MSEKNSQSVRVKSISLQLLDELFSTETPLEVCFRLWDGTIWPDDNPVLQRPY